MAGGLGALAAASLGGCGRAASVAATTEHLSITISSAMATNGWPRYGPAVFTVRHGSLVTLVIKNTDDGPAPVPEESGLNRVQGGTETVDGRPLRVVPMSKLSHTFTIFGEGINVPIPAAPTGSSDTIVFTFRAPPKGSYFWHCLAPCGTGSDGMIGPMATADWMNGIMKVA